MAMMVDALLKNALEHGTPNWDAAEDESALKENHGPRRSQEEEHLHSLEAAQAVVHARKRIVDKTT